MQKNNASIPEYTTYPKLFASYRWYKPLLTCLLVGIFYMIFSSIVVLITIIWGAAQGVNIMDKLNVSYDALDAYSPIGAFLSFGNIIAFLPALLLGNRIVNARPFSSYSSSRGGFNFADFFKSFGPALVLLALPIGIYSFVTLSQKGDVRFDVAGIIFCIILCPLQCIAEEYIFRGLLMQTFGSWIKFPAIPILLQAICFAAMHPYNIWGIIAAGSMGIILGVCTCITKGLEASCALHVANNMTTFFLSGFGISSIATSVSFMDFLFPIIFCLLYLGFIVLATKKFGWFSKVKKDDVASFNANVQAKQN